MLIRKANEKDLPHIVRLARKFDLDYEGMEADAFWVAEADGRIAGIVGLRRHSDCRELCSLGVDESFRGRGLGRELVQALIEATEGDIYLATIIPRYFEKAGFVRVSEFPISMVKKAEWCAGCDRNFCAVMLREAA